jgi:hypothetical protein
MSVNKTDLHKKLANLVQSLQKYDAMIFFVFLAVIYGFLLWRITSLSQATPDPSTVATKAQATHSPHIDQSVVNKIQQLQDNSVNVQALFDEARSNPFQE